MRRVSANRGSFYPQECMDIEQMIGDFNSMLEKSTIDDKVLMRKPRAVIAPHAGYIYSGFTANIAHRLLANSKPKRIVVIGPSHYLYFSGVSGSMMDSFETPCGDLSIDQRYLSDLSDKFSLEFIPEAHYREHSTETQMPFIKYYHQNVEVIELIYGAETDHYDLALIMDEILSDEENCLVISSDLSHFYTQREAETLDSICLSGIEQRDITILNDGCEACGITGIKAIVEIAKKYEYHIEVLDYRTSADASGDQSRVVGYTSAAVF